MIVALTIGFAGLLIALLGRVWLSMSRLGFTADVARAGPNMGPLDCIVAGLAVNVPYLFISNALEFPSFWSLFGAPAAPSPYVPLVLATAVFLLNQFERFYGAPCLSAAAVAALPAHGARAVATVIRLGIAPTERDVIHQSLARRGVSL